VLKIRRGSGRASSRACLWNGFWRTACPCGWDCNCTNSFGTRGQGRLNPGEKSQLSAETQRAQRRRGKSRKKRIRNGTGSEKSGGALEWRDGLLREHGDRTPNATARQTLPCSMPATASALRSANVARSRTLRIFTACTNGWPCNSITFARLADPRSRTKAFSVPENELGAPGAHGSAIPVTYVPFSKRAFSFRGGELAEAIGAGAIFIGAVAEDSSGYPDCRPEYYRVLPGVDPRGTRPGKADRNRNAGHHLRKARSSGGHRTARAAASNLVVLPKTKILPAAPR